MKAAILILLAAILGVALWGASELHYRSCVESAEARTPAPTSGRPSINRFLTPPDEARARERAVEGCSRLPF